MVGKRFSARRDNRKSEASLHRQSALQWSETSLMTDAGREALLTKIDGMPTPKSRRTQSSMMIRGIIVVASFAVLGACVGDDPGSAESSDDAGSEAGVGDANGADGGTASADGSPSDDGGSDGGSDVGVDVDAAPPCYPNPSGQIAWWTADGTYDDKKGTYPLTAAPLVQGGTVNFVAGKVAQAFELKDAFLLKQSVSGIFTLGYTVEGWMNAQVNLGSIAGANLQGSATILISFSNETTLNFHFGSSNLAAPAPPAKKWVHLAGTWEGMAGTKTHLYVDGVEVGTSQTQTAGVSFDVLKLGGAGPFGGLLDEWAMYGRALLASEVQEIVNAGPSGRCKN